MRRVTVFYGNSVSLPKLFCGGMFLLFFFCLYPVLHAASQPSLDLEISASQKSQDELSQEAEGILEDLADLRGVHLMKKVNIAFANKDFFGRYYLRRLQTQYPSAEKTNYEEAFQALGLLGKGEDLFSSYINVFLSVVQGLYDPETKTLVMLQDGSTSDQERIMAHELVHALQDQQFDLKAFLEGEKGLSLDEQFARTSLIEGEAEGLSLDWRLREEGKDFTSIGDIAPWVEQGNSFKRAGLKAIGKRTVSADAINFPYVYGVTFFQRWVRLKGWKNTDQLYRHPPRTTQQIMNEGCYFPHPLPYVRVQLADLSGKPLQGYRRIWENSLGEFGWEMVLRNYLGEEDSSRAVTGWEGDEVQVYEGDHDPSPLLTSFLVFRDEKSSNLFFNAAKSCLEKKEKIQNWIRDDDTISWAALADGKEVYLEKFGKRVIWLENTPLGFTPRIRAALWDFQRVPFFVAHPN